MVHVDFDAATERRVRLAARLADLISIAACALQPLLRAGVPLAPPPDGLDALKVALDRQKHRSRLILVAGACGHIRVFGVIRYDLLHKSPVCCLFSH